MATSFLHKMFALFGLASKFFRVIGRPQLLAGSQFLFSPSTALNSPFSKTFYLDLQFCWRISPILLVYIMLNLSPADMAKPSY